MQMVQKSNRVQRYHHAGLDWSRCDRSGLSGIWTKNCERRRPRKLRLIEAKDLYHTGSRCVSLHFWIWFCCEQRFWQRRKETFIDFQEFWSGIYETVSLSDGFALIPPFTMPQISLQLAQVCQIALGRESTSSSILVQPCLATPPVMEPTARATATRHTRMGRTATAIAIIPMDHLKARATTTPTLGAAMDSTHPNQTLPVVSIRHTPTTALETRTPGASRRELSSRGG